MVRPVVRFSLIETCHLNAKRVNFSQKEETPAMPVKILAILLMISIPLLAQPEFKPAADCGKCHKEIFQQWSGSMHALSTVQENPIFRGMYNLAVEETAGKLKEKCQICHSPMSVVFGNIDMQHPYNREGVTCQFCHGVREIRAYQTARDFAVDLNKIYGGKKPARKAPHPVEVREFFNKSDFCLPCHAVMKNPKDLDVCSTGSEWKAYYDKHRKTCQDCHMPQIKGIPSHVFPGMHQGEILDNGVEMKMQFESTTGKLQLTLTNKGAGHAIPTGTPLRMVFLKVTAYDSSGKLLWQNWKDNPIKEDRSALFMRILGDSAGNGPVPPWRAVQTVYDRRLMPEEPVTISYSLDSQNIYDIEAKLFYRYAPEPVLRQFGITTPHFTQPRLIVQQGVKVM